MKSRILIIDDNVALTTLLAKALAKFGYQPVVENNPLLAVNTVRHYMPDLILLDVMMPERDGGRVLYDLRSDLSLRYIPVVLLTAIAREAQTLANTGGIQSIVLAKPVQLQELISVIEGQLKASMSFNQLEESGTSKRTAAFHDLPDFDQEEGATPVMGIFPQTSPVSPPSSAFSNQFPEREAAETGGNGQSRFAFPPRSDEGML
ncbi:MAG: response regulator, partial [Verrucomicrobiae bacterium]|nr:response regulator [Verrucomicrobiae bacterium]